MSVLLMTVWLTGCVQEELGSTPSPAGNGIRFTLTVPDVNLPSVSSRTMTGTAKKEDEIETVDILVFDMSKTPAVYLECVSATGVTQDLADNSTVSFSAVLSPTTASTCIVVVANKELDNIVSGFMKGTTTKLRQWKRCSTPRPANGWQTVRRLVGIRGFRCTGRR